MSTSTLELPADRQQDTASWAAIAFIASYSSRATRRTYTTHLRLWMAWCAAHQLDPLADIRRPHVELYARELGARGLAAATVALKLVVLTGFYRYCVEEQLVDHSPAVHVRRPKVSLSLSLHHLSLISDALPKKIIMDCGLDYDRWYPMPRRMIGASQFLRTHRRDREHHRRTLDTLGERFDIRSGPVRVA